MIMILKNRYNLLAYYENTDWVNCYVTLLFKLGLRNANVYCYVTLKAIMVIWTLSENILGLL